MTDPPWCPRAHRHALTRPRSRATGRADLPCAPLPADAIPRLAGGFARLVKRWVLLFVGELQVGPWCDALEGAGLRVVRVGAVVRANPVPRWDRKAPAPGHDPLIIVHGPAPLAWNGGGRPAVWRAHGARWDAWPAGTPRHPAAKSLGLLCELLGAVTAPGDLVLDPFAGSGTTALACRDLGRRFIGWEVDAGYHATAMARLDRETVTQARRRVLSEASRGRLA